MPLETGLFFKQPLTSSRGMPLLRSSAGFSSVGTKCQKLGSQMDCILATQTPTKGLNETDSEFNQCNMILESDQKVMETSLILNSSQIVWTRREATREAISSSRRIVVCCRCNCSLCCDQTYLRSLYCWPQKVSHGSISHDACVSKDMQLRITRHICRLQALGKFKGSKVLDLFEHLPTLSHFIRQGVVPVIVLRSPNVL